MVVNAIHRTQFTKWDRNGIKCKSLLLEGFQAGGPLSAESKTNIAVGAHNVCAKQSGPPDYMG